MLDKYYEARGWDKKNGLILKDTLKKLAMEEVLKKLEREGLVM